MMEIFKDYITQNLTQSINSHTQAAPGTFTVTRARLGLPSSLIHKNYSVCLLYICYTFSQFRAGSGNTWLHGRIIYEAAYQVLSRDCH